MKRFFSTRSYLIQAAFRILLLLAAIMISGCSQFDQPASPDELTSGDSVMADTSREFDFDTECMESARLNPNEDERIHYIENEVLVVLDNETENSNGETFFDGLSLHLERTHNLKWGVLRKFTITDGGSVEDTVSNLKTLEGIRFAEPNYVRYFDVAPYWPNDPMWESDDAGEDPRNSVWEQWGPAKLGASIVWNDTKGSEDIVVAIVDTGIRRTHEDLQDSIWNNSDEIPSNGIDDDNNGYIDDTWGWNAYQNNNNPFDDGGYAHYHGTGCAGVVAATQDNNVGISGVAPGVKLMAVKVLFANNYTSDETIAAALDYVASNEVDFVSMSFGGTDVSPVLETAINNCWDNGDGPLLLASAGNSNNTNPHYPSGYDVVMSIGATVPFSRWNVPCDEGRIRPGWESWWWGSNYGDNLTVMAFGEKYYSTYGSGNSEYWDGVDHYFFNGTSCACPNAVAVAALTKTMNPGQTNEWYWDRLEETADDLDVPGFDTQTGHGRVNAVRAVYGSDRFEDLEDDNGFVAISPDANSLALQPPLFDTIHDRPGNPYHDTSDLYRITTGWSGPLKIYLDIYTWGENLDMALYSDEDMTLLIDSDLTVNHATTSFEEINLNVEAGEDYYLEIFSPSEGSSTTYGLFVEYEQNVLDVSGESIAPMTAHPGDYNVPFLKLNFDILYPGMLDSIAFTTSGGDIQASWGLVRLYEDTNADGTLDDNDMLLAIKQENTGNLTVFESLAYYLDNENPVTMFVTADLNTDIDPGTVVRIDLIDPGDVVALTNVVTDPPGLPVYSGNVIVTN